MNSPSVRLAFFQFSRNRRPVSGKHCVGPDMRSAATEAKHYENQTLIRKSDWKNLRRVHVRRTTAGMASPLNPQP